MTDFERIKYYFSKGWAKSPQMQLYVQLGVIKAAEYEAITGHANQATA